MGRIRRYGLVGEGVALLEEVWPCWRRHGLVERGVALLEGCGLVGGDVSLHNIRAMLSQRSFIWALFPLPHSILRLSMSSSRL